MPQSPDIMDGMNTGESSPGRSEARVLVGQIFAALPALHRFHARSDPLFRHLDGIVAGYFESGSGEVLDIEPFEGVYWPRMSLGNLSSYCFFGLGEMVLHAFYWRNRERYRTFFDVGAHMGVDSLLAAHLGYRVWAFEPDPENHRLMRDILARNGCTTVEPIRAGIADTAGDVEFVRVAGNTTANHVAGARDFHGPVERLDAAMTTFEAIGFLPDLMKINVEGFEKVVVPTIPQSAWSATDAFVEIHDIENRDAIFEHFDGTGINLFTQKTGWRPARERVDLPKNNKEGYLFISRRRRMPW